MKSSQIYRTTDFVLKHSPFSRWYETVSFEIVFRVLHCLHSLYHRSYFDNAIRKQLYYFCWTAVFFSVFHFYVINFYETFMEKLTQGLNKFFSNEKQHIAWADRHCKLTFQMMCWHFDAFIYLCTILYHRARDILGYQVDAMRGLSWYLFCHICDAHVLKTCHDSCEFIVT